VIDPLERWREFGEKPDYAGLLSFAGMPYSEDPADLEGADVAIPGGIAIDTKGFGSVAFAVYAGAITTVTGAVLKIMETDNSDGTTGITEVPAYQQANTFTKSPDDSNKVKCVAAVPTKRYVVLRITTTGTVNLVIKGAVAVLGGAADAPVSTN
jgi:hypothetical protein